MSTPLKNEVDAAALLHETRAALSELIERLNVSEIAPEGQHVHALASGVEHARRVLQQLRDAVARRSGDAASSMADTNARGLQTQLSMATGELEVQLSSARQRADQGYETVHAVLEELENSKGWSESVRGIISGLATDVSRIEQVVQVVTDVGKRIRILALNTSILAVRAGELGAAFGVVAREIQALSDRTGETIATVVSQVRTVQARTTQAAERTSLTLRKLAEGISVSFSAGDTLGGVREDVRIAQRTVTHMNRLVESVTTVAAPQENRQAGARLADLDDQLRSLATTVSALLSGSGRAMERDEIIARLENIVKRIDRR